MKNINRVVSIIILTCFLFNTAFSDLAFGLAAPLGTSDIVGIQPKDTARIKFALQDKLTEITHNPLSVNRGTFQTILKQWQAKEKTIFHPAGMQFFWQEPKHVTAGSLCYMVRLKDKYGLRTYYATFSLQKDEFGWFPINVYTEEQYNKAENFVKRTPQIKQQDAKAIQRYIRHEEGIDAVIAYAHEKGLAKEPVKSRFDYKAFVINDMPERFNIKLNNPHKLIPIQNRNFFLIPLTEEVERMKAKLPKAKIIDAKGKEHEVEYFAHSSNNAIHVFVREDYFKYLTDENYSRYGEDPVSSAVLDVQATIMGEIGAICKQPVIKVVKDRGDGAGDIVINTVNERVHNVLTNGHDRKPNKTLMLTIADLDHIADRNDYAGGKNSINKTKQIEVIRVLEALVSDAHVRRQMEDGGLLGAEHSMSKLCTELELALERVGHMKEDELPSTPEKWRSLLKVYITDADTINVAIEAITGKRSLKDTATKTKDHPIRGKIILKTPATIIPGFSATADYTALAIMRRNMPFNIALLTVGQWLTAGEDNVSLINKMISKDSLTNYKPIKLTKRTVRKSTNSSWTFQPSLVRLTKKDEVPVFIILTTNNIPVLYIGVWDDDVGGISHYEGAVASGITAKDVDKIIAKIPKQEAYAKTVLNTWESFKSTLTTAPKSAPAKAKSRAHPGPSTSLRAGKSPKDLIGLIKKYYNELPNNIISAPAVLKLYEAHYQEMGFEAPAEDRASALKTIERDLFASDNCMENRKWITRFSPAKGNKGEFLFVLTSCIKGQNEDLFLIDSSIDNRGPFTVYSRGTAKPIKELEGLRIMGTSPNYPVTSDYFYFMSLSHFAFLDASTNTLMIYDIKAGKMLDSTLTAEYFKAFIPQKPMYSEDLDGPPPVITAYLPGLFEVKENYLLTHLDRSIDPFNFYIFDIKDGKTEMIRKISSTCMDVTQVERYIFTGRYLVTFSGYDFRYPTTGIDTDLYICVASDLLTGESIEARERITRHNTKQCREIAEKLIQKLKNTAEQSKVNATKKTAPIAAAAKGPTLQAARDIAKRVSSLSIGNIEDTIQELKGLLAPVKIRTAMLPILAISALRKHGIISKTPKGSSSETDLLTKKQTQKCIDVLTETVNILDAVEVLRYKAMAKGPALKAARDIAQLMPSSSGEIKDTIRTLKGLLAPVKIRTNMLPMLAIPVLRAYGIIPKTSKDKDADSGSDLLTNKQAQECVNVLAEVIRILTADETQAPVAAAAKDDAAEKKNTIESVTIGDRIKVGDKEGLVLKVLGDSVEYMTLYGIGREGLSAIKKVSIKDINEIIPPRYAPEFLFNPGDKVEVKYKEHWYPGTIVEAAGGVYAIITYEKVHDRTNNYLGYGLTTSYFEDAAIAEQYGLRKATAEEQQKMPEKIFKQVAAKDQDEKTADFKVSDMPLTIRVNKTVVNAPGQVLAEIIFIREGMSANIKTWIRRPANELPSYTALLVGEKLNKFNIVLKRDYNTLPRIINELSVVGGTNYEPASIAKAPVAAAAPVLKPLEGGAKDRALLYYAVVISKGNHPLYNALYRPSIDDLRAAGDDVTAYFLGRDEKGKYFKVRQKSICKDYTYIFVDNKDGATCVDYVNMSSLTPQKADGVEKPAAPAAAKDDAAEKKAPALLPTLQAKLDKTSPEVQAALNETFFADKEALSLVRDIRAIEDYSSWWKMTVKLVNPQAPDKDYIMLSINKFKEIAGGYSITCQVYINGDSLFKVEPDMVIGREKLKEQLKYILGGLKDGSNIARVPYIHNWAVAATAKDEKAFEIAGKMKSVFGNAEANDSVISWSDGMRFGYRIEIDLKAKQFKLTSERVGKNFEFIQNLDKASIKLAQLGGDFQGMAFKVMFYNRNKNEIALVLSNEAISTFGEPAMCYVQPKGPWAAGMKIMSVSDFAKLRGEFYNLIDADEIFTGPAAAAAAPSGGEMADEQSDVHIVNDRQYKTLPGWTLFEYRTANGQNIIINFIRTDSHSCHFSGNSVKMKAFFKQQDNLFVEVVMPVVEKTIAEINKLLAGKNNLSVVIRETAEKNCTEICESSGDVFTRDKLLVSIDENVGPGKITIRGDDFGEKTFLEAPVAAAAKNGSDEANKLAATVPGPILSAIQQFDLATLLVARDMVTDAPIGTIREREISALKKMEPLLGVYGRDSIQKLLKTASAEPIIEERIQTFNAQRDTQIKIQNANVLNTIKKFDLATLLVARDMVTDAPIGTIREREISALKKMEPLLGVYGWDSIQKLLKRASAGPVIEERIASLTVVEAPVAAVSSSQIDTLRENLRNIAARMAPVDGGILAADESTGTAGKRLESVGLPNTAENRQTMRQLILTVPGQEKAGVSGVILYSETFNNVDKQGKNLVQEHLVKRGILPGIKTDAGLIDDPDSPGEKLPDPKGLQNLPKLLEEYKAKGAVFTKWRVTQSIDPVKDLPTDANIRKNAVVLAKSSKLTQEAGLVPIFEPEVLLDGAHDIDTSYKVTTRTLEIVFGELVKAGVWLDGAILKTSMILSGNKAANRADSETVGYYTLKGLLKTVPAEVPAIVFLSGGQEDDEVNENLDAVTRASQTKFETARNEAAAELKAEGKDAAAAKLLQLTKAPWQLSYSFGRGLQRPGLKAWAGKEENFKKAQEALLEAARTTQNARMGLLKQPITAQNAAEQQEIDVMIPLAREAGLQIPTHPDSRYNLLVTSEFFSNGELKEHQQTYGDRFNLDMVSGRTADEFINNVLANPNAVSGKAIVLLPDELPSGKFEDKHYQALKDKGIRFMIVNRNELLTARTEKDGYRAKFQVDTYAMMLLMRAIDENTGPDSPIYKLLSFYLNTHFKFTEAIAIDDYIMAISKNEIGKLIRAILNYRPAQAYDKPDYNNVAASLISA